MIGGIAFALREPLLMAKKVEACGSDGGIVPHESNRNPASGRALGRDRYYH